MAIEFQFTDIKLSVDENGSTNIILQVDSENSRYVKAQIKPLQEVLAKNKKLTATLKKQRRSLDANAYFWVLCGKLSAKINVPPEIIYKEYIKDIGDNYVIYPTKNEAIEKWINVWGSRGKGWICETLGECKTEGYTNVLSYFGSSVYDSSQMWRLINLVIDDCKNNDIETMTPEQLNRLMGGWDNE